MKKSPPRTIRAPHSRENPYFMYSRATAQNESLSWAARGVLAYMLSKPDDWEIEAKDLQQGCGRDKVYAILDELEKAGHIQREKAHDEKGQFDGYAYFVYEHPCTEIPDTVKPAPCPEKPLTAEPLTENPQHTYKREEQNTELTDLSAEPANAGSQASDTTMQQFNESAKPALTPVQENPLPTKSDQNADQKESSAKEKGTAQAPIPLYEFLSYGSSRVHYSASGKQSLCGQRLSATLSTVVSANQNLLPCPDCVPPQPSATPPNAAEASPMPQNSTRAVLEAVLEFPPVPKGFAWVYSSATDQPLAHLTAGSVKGVTLCKNKLNYRDFYNPGMTVVRRQPCAECLRIAAEQTMEKPPKDNRHGDLFKAWIDVVGKETLPAGFSYSPYMNFCKSLVKEGYDVGDMTCAGFLVRRWHEANGQPIIDWKPAVVIDNIRKALALCKAGVTGSDVAIFIAAKRSESYWSGKVVPFSYVATNISTGKAAVNNGSELQESTLSGESRGDVGPEDRTNWRAEAAARLPVIPASSRVR